MVEPIDWNMRYAGPCPLCKRRIVTLRWNEGWRAYHVAPNTSTAYACGLTKTQALYLLEGVKTTCLTTG